MKPELCAALVVCSLGCGHAKPDVDPRLKEFAKQKRQQMDELAGKLDLGVPREIRKFFRAAEAGDWASVSNQFAGIYPRVGQYEGTTYDPAFNSVLWIPLQETDSAYALFALWEPRLLQKYADGILASIPTGSIYLGGTDPGRFAATLFRDVAKSPDIFVITQNALADSRYMEYLRLTYGDRLWLPAVTNVQAAFQQYVTKFWPLNDGLILTNGAVVQVQGVSNVMVINGILAKMIFENNKAQHEFYVEESFVIDWMFPYLEPHGPILKLNKEPLEKLDSSTIERDREFWDKLTQELLSDPKFLANDESRKMYAKMRSAIGGLYAYRHLTNEAEATFKQAIKLGPTLTEAPFRLAELCVNGARFDDAITVLEPLENLQSPPLIKEKTLEAIRQVREMKAKAEQAK